MGHFNVNWYTFREATLPLFLASLLNGSPRGEDFIFKS